MLDVDGHQVAQDERPGQGFIGHLVFEGIGDDGHAHGDALVAAAAVAHGGQGASGHAGVGGCGREAHGKAHEVVPEHLLLVLADGPAHLQAVLPFQSLMCKGQVEGAVFQNEGNVFEGGR